MLQRLIIAAMVMAAGLIAANGALQAQTLDKIKQRGVVVIGTKADYKPFGFRDPRGAIVGFEPDLARDVADRLQRQAAIGAGGLVEPHAVPAAGQNRPHDRHHERDGRAAQNRRHHRAELLRLGVNVFANRKVALKRWEALKDQKVCGIQGAFFNKYVAEKYGAEIVAFRGQNKAETALFQGNCIAWLYDDTAFAERLADPKWAGFEMPLETILSEPWGAAVKLEERGGPWGQFIAKTVADWHRSGKLIELEKKWNIAPSAFLKKAQAEAK